MTSGGWSELQRLVSWQGLLPATTTVRRTDGIAGAAFGLDAELNGIDLGTTRWRRGDPAWRARAAPWLLPLIDDEDGPLGDVLDLVFQEGGAFSMLATPQWHEPGDAIIARAAGEMQSQFRRRTRALDHPAVLVESATIPRVVLLEHEESVLAFVGKADEGVIFAFTPSDPAVIGLSHPGIRYAFVLASMFYTDLVAPAPATTSSGNFFRRTVGGGSGASRWYRYLPTKAFERQRSAVLNGTRVPPRSHYVAGHVRDLGNGIGSIEARRRAPTDIRRRLGEHQTWVRGYTTGDGDAAVPHYRPGAASALADAIALLDRGSEQREAE